MAAWKENVQDWLAVDAGLRELFSALKFRVTGKNQGKTRLWFQPFGDNPRIPSLLAPISAIFRPIGWSDPLNWHTRDGHTFRGGNASGEKKAIFPEVPAHSCRAHEDLRERRRVGQG